MKLLVYAINEVLNDLVLNVEETILRSQVTSFDFNLYM